MSGSKKNWFYFLTISSIIILSLGFVLAQEVIKSPEKDSSDKVNFAEKTIENKIIDKVIEEPQKETTSKGGGSSKKKTDKNSDKEKEASSSKNPFVNEDTKFTGSVQFYVQGELVGNEFFFKGHDIKGISESIGEELQGEIEPKADVIDVFDLLEVLQNWGPCPAQGDCPGDYDNDGFVDSQDLKIILAFWAEGEPEGEGEIIFDVNRVDVDKSGIVDIFDLLMILSAWQNGCDKAIESDYCDEDVNQDHLINGIDISLILEYWGHNFLESLPEPTSTQTSAEEIVTGSANVPYYETQWDCSAWSACNPNTDTQTRTCTKESYSGFAGPKPAEVQSCQEPEIETLSAEQPNNLANPTAQQQGVLSRITGAVVGPNGVPTVGGVVGFLALLLVAYLIVAAARRRS